MKYNGFYFWLFFGQMKKVLAEQSGREYVWDIMKRSKPVYDELVKQETHIGCGNPMDYSYLLTQPVIK